MKKKYIIEVDESELIEYLSEQGIKEVGHQEYVLKSCLNIKAKPYKERTQGEFTLNDLKGYLLFYGYSSDAVEDTLINFESYVKGKRGGVE